jgi:hypothetical protein
MRYLITISFSLFIAFLFLGYGKKEVKITEGIQPGYLAPGLNLQDVDFNGKDYVLLQFWAAYDPQSRVRNAQMHNVIAQTEVENFRLISISLDENRSVFEGTIKADHLDETTQFNESTGRQSALFKAYRLKTGFSNWLINPNGVVVAKNISPNEIQAMFSGRK